jgi:DnaK suppressor protein
MQKYRKMMTDLKLVLTTRIDTNLRDTAENVASSSEDVDQVQQKESNDIILKIVARDQARLKQVDEAIRQIDRGNYGTCQSCDCEIDERRLLAMPLTLNCLECQEDLDKQ